MIFETIIQKKSEPKPKPNVIGQKGPEIGDIHVTEKFAWWPTKINYHPDGPNFKKDVKQYVWMDFYTKQEKWNRNLKLHTIFPNHSSLLHMGVESRWVEEFEWEHINNLKA